MALTENQLYNLAVGDEVIVHGKCEDICSDGDIRVNTYWTVLGEKREQSFLVHHHYVSLPPEKPKYDPCRKVKKGDRVKPRIVYGRIPIFGIDGIAIDVSSGDFIVETDEGIRSNGTVDVKYSDGTIMTVDPVYLELVTPVEELDPYYVKETEYEFCVAIMVGERKDFPAIYHKRMHPHAKEAAEAECERLNAEWRKKNISK